MSENQPAVATASNPPAEKLITPVEFLATVEGAPTPEQIQSWKREVLNGKVRLFNPDGKRVYLLRGLNGMEVRALESRIPGNSSYPEIEQQMLAVEAATLWTNTTPSKKLDVQVLKASGAGLPATLFQIVSELSDFMDPVQVAQRSGDL